MSEIKKQGKQLYYLSVLTLVLTFCMIVLGGVVKNTGSSMACPDWPTCNGSLMPEMVGAVAIEHSHRILGTVLGILACLMVLVGVRARKKEPLLHYSTLLALGLVIAQGVLGGLTVLNKISAFYSSLHLGLSHLFFATVLFIAFKSCATSCEQKSKDPTFPPKLITFAKIACALVFIQICLGGIIRHFGAGPACGLGWQAAFLCQELDTGVRTLWPHNGPGQLHMLHRLNGYLVMFALIGLTIPLLKFARLNKLPSLRRLLIAIHATVFIQVTIGLHVVSTYISAVIVTLHLAFGLLLWALVLSVFFRLNKKHMNEGAQCCA